MIETDNNKYFIVQSNKKAICTKSSSGGMFAELAKFVLSQNGVVFGCAMERVEEGFDIKHIYIEDEKDLYKLQGSKYVQSRIGNTIKEAKEFLDKGRFVLYSGTPCQIAGLKAYLKQDYDKLLTVDLSCTGTPSLEMFNSFIKFLEKKFGQKIIKFEFRNKERMGWSCGNALITFENGKQKILYNNTTSYLYLFINKKLQNRSCQECKYTGLERISDVTVADAWGIEKEYPKVKNKFNINNGISLVIVNTNKAEKIIKQLSENNIIIESVDVNRLRKYNNPLTSSQNNIFDDTYLAEYKKFGYKGIEDLFKHKLGNKYYYNILKNHTPKFIKKIIKIFYESSINSTDILLMTWYNWANYGSILTAYALYQTIGNLGYSVKQIQFNRPVSYAKPFAKKYFDETPLCINNKQLESLQKIANTYIVGADNQLDYGAIGNVVYRSLLNFTNENSKKLLIAGSFGSWDWNAEEQSLNIIKTLLERFDFVSVREYHSQKKLKDAFGIDAQWIIDPVFFLEQKEYLKLIHEADDIDYSNSIMNYILYPNEDATRIIDKLKKEQSLEEHCFNGNHSATIQKYNSKVKVENWLKSILTSKYVVTDSFHCFAFCIIFNRPVICIKNKCDISRFESIKRKFNIKIPIYKNFEDFDKNHNFDLKINWDDINKQIAEERKKILQIINTELKNNINKTDEQKDAEKKHVQMKKVCYQNQDKFYKKNAIFYRLIVEPIFVPIVRYLKNRKFYK